MWNNLDKARCDKPVWGSAIWIGGLLHQKFDLGNLKIEESTFIISEN